MPDTQKPKPELPQRKRRWDAQSNARHDAVVAVPCAEAGGAEKVRYPKLSQNVILTQW
jgi:hypothetical protein